MIRRQLVGAGLILGIVFGLGIDTYNRTHETFETHFVYVAEAKEPEVVQIEVKIDWTDKERVKQEIRNVFPEEPETMIRVAECESGLVADIEGPTNDHGIFQIHIPSHKNRLTGIDLTDPAQNIAFARKLYDESGKRPWSASSKCWSK